jgi:two-component system chemotaxis response regulator CheY
MSAESEALSMGDRNPKGATFVKTILAVDDSATVRQVAGLVLRGAGYHVIEAVDGVDALSKLTGQELSLILTDLNMPNMNGLEFTRRVRSLPNYKFVPVILLTTESQPEKKQEGKAAGATAWIVKPFDPDKLLAVVNKVLS